MALYGPARALQMNLGGSPNKNWALQERAGNCTLFELNPPTAQDKIPEYLFNVLS